MWTEGIDAAGTDEWLGEFGRDLHGPIESCCFFLMATTFWATGDESGKDTATERSLILLRAHIKKKTSKRRFNGTVMRV